MDTPSNIMFTLSEQQTRIVEEFRERVKDIVQEDSFFDFYPQRWLIARSWNVAKAEAMLRAAFEWRHKHKMDTIIETWEPPEVLRKYVPGGIAGYDKMGSPVWVETVGRIDVRGLFASVRISDMKRNRFYVLETCDRKVREMSEQRNQYTGGVTMIYDFEHFGLKHLWKPGIDLATGMFETAEQIYPELLKQCFIVNAFKVGTEFFDVSEKHFPEQLKSGYVVNAPKIFYVAYNIIKRFLHEESRKKIHVLGSDWKEKLREVIDPDQLPVHWGGTKMDPDGDEFCQSKVCIGGQVPVEYYSKNRQLSDMSNLTETVITSRSDFKINLTIDVPMSVIRWEFRTQDKDIGFDIFRKTDDDPKQRVSSMESMIDSQRVNSHMVLEEGTLVVEIPGLYIIRFDNKYSWFTKKKLFYDVDVLPPCDGTT